ncbi:phosphatidylglycerophosphatase A [Nitratidesulfovibrio sp. HK-II]|uniref:phosphatidylglycerophosphatase A family protein n=1 Tax=Nitratidesulfovibrio sp. HK-II TaxID=2009266 RepID=UPI000E2F1F48|nr:phosphatidylglycerophosphatase A [Nitratidesulfovibrio sp. HK-II]GBO98066.1 phosphatidylglycerophosphatase A [Nitratidesulfovibrio sp. HK-II]
MSATNDNGPERCTPPDDLQGLDRLALEVARVWYAGRSPVAPGTVGSAVAALLAPWMFLPLPLGWRVTALLALFCGGAWAAGRAARLLGRCDPGSVVIDEVAGQWTAMLPFATLSPLGVLAAFVLFRVFDIIKPGPVGASESWFAGGPGIMIDDVVAGVCAAAVLAVLSWLGLPV